MLLEKAKHPSNTAPIIKTVSHIIPMIRVVSVCEPRIATKVLLFVAASRSDEKIKPHAEWPNYRDENFHPEASEDFLFLCFPPIVAHILP
jgi:hypothetical protein